MQTLAVGLLLAQAPTVAMNNLRLLALSLTTAFASGVLAQDVSLQQAFPALRFERPVDFQQAGGLLFVVEQQGIIKVFDHDPAASQVSVFLDIRSKVSRRGNEEGLLGLAFSPNYSISGIFYVYYSRSNAMRSILARYRRSPMDERAADPTSEEVLMTVEQPYRNHNGGQIAFGPDGYLYIGLGDGGSGGDPLGHGQNRATLLGSILRIDVSTTPYGIPPDNPFVGNTSGYREEIWAWGLRNPWRFSFDEPTGRLYLADVGQDAWEEIDIIVKGNNYGWRIMEGPACFQPPSGCSQSGLTLPVHSYPLDGGRRSVTGGYVYRSTSVPSLQGKYIYADYINGVVWALDTDSTAQNRELKDTSYNIASFGRDAYGEVYALAFNGRIYRFKPAPLQMVSTVEDQAYSVGSPIMPLVLPGATGGVVPYSYRLSESPPPGLVLDEATRTISGTPTGAMPSTSYSWKATDRMGTTASTYFTIRVHEATVREAEPPPTGVMVHGQRPQPFFAHDGHRGRPGPQCAGCRYRAGPLGANGPHCAFAPVGGRSAAAHPGEHVPTCRAAPTCIASSWIPELCAIYEPASCFRCADPFQSRNTLAAAKRKSSTCSALATSSLTVGAASAFHQPKSL